MLESRGSSLGLGTVVVPLLVVVAFQSRCVDGKDNGRSEDINSDFTGTEYCACDVRCDVVVGIASSAAGVVVVVVGGVMVATSTRAAVPRLHSSLPAVVVVLIVMVKMLVLFATIGTR